MWATGLVVHLSMLVATFLIISLGAGPSLLSELGSLSVSKVSRGIARKVVNQEVNPSQQDERSSLGLCPCLYKGGWGWGGWCVVICLCVCRHIDPDRPIVYKRWFALSACSQCEIPFFMFQPWQAWGQCWCSSSAGWLPATVKRTIPHCRYGPRLFVWPAEWYLIFTADCKLSRN